MATSEPNKGTPDESLHSRPVPPALPRSEYDRQEDDFLEDDLPRRRRRSRNDDEERPYATWIPYRNVSALLGYYAGMLGLIAILGGIAFIAYSTAQGFRNTRLIVMVALIAIYGLGGLCALLGVVLGILGIVHARGHPESRGLGHAATGLTLGCLEIAGLLTLLILGMLLWRR
jgi:hypothetical protein